MRELPFERSRLEPSVGPVLHAVTRRTEHAPLSLIALGLLIGLAAPAYAQSPAPSDTQTPAPTPQTPAQPAATPEAEVWHSLFDIAPNQLLLGGRASSIDGDPARFQRYQDVRDGLLFTGARHARGSGRRVAAQGRRGQRRLARSTVLRQLRADGPLQGHGRLPSDPAVLQRRHEDALYGQRRDAPARRRDAAGDPVRPGEPEPYVPIAPQFDLRERRDIGHVDVVATPTPKLDVTASFTTQKHSGELPWGASFGFSNDVEVPLPYDSRTNDFTIGTEWTNTKNMLRVAYSGSWFDNLDTTLVWDSPLRLDDASGTPDAAACRCGRPTPRRRSASAATPSWRTRRRSPGSSPTDCGATTSRCSRSPSIRRCRRSRFRAPTRTPRRTCSRRT